MAFLTPFVPWLNLTHKLSRLVMLLSGIVFSVILLFMFTGFQNALFDSQLEIVKHFKADLFILSQRRPSIAIPSPISRQIVYQAQAFDGIQSASPLYLGEAFWKNSETQAVRLARVIAFNLNEPLLDFPELQGDISPLRLPNTVWVDRLARPELGKREPGTVTELGNREIRVVGNFTLGNDFASLNGNLLMSDSNFQRYFANRDPKEGDRSLDEIDMVFLTIDPQGDPDAIAKTLRQNLPESLQVFTRAELEQWEYTYWNENSNIGFVFGILTIMAFVIGVILSYQIIYADINDHLTEYATLKAMGYRDRFLVLVVFQEALLLGTMGFIPGAFLSYGLYFMAKNVTGLVFQMTLQRSVELFSWTIGMCFVSGVLSLFKVQQSEPADIF